MSISPTSFAGISGVGGGTSLGKDAFLNLLVIQLQNQDPLNPLDNEAMLGQLAQFSQLEELQTLSQASLAQIGAIESVNNAIATTLIGKEVKAIGDTFSYEAETSERFEFVAPTTGPIEVAILDQNGSVLYTETIDFQGPGFGEFTWNGMDANGDPVESGTYQISVNQKDAEGSSQSAVTFVTDTVTGVRFTDGITYLLLGDQRVPLSDVLEIKAPGGQLFQRLNGR